MTEFTLLPLSALTFPNIDPVALSLGPLQIHWYGLGYVVGILFAWFYARWLIGKPAFWGKLETGITTDHLDVFVVWATIGVLLGGRIGYALFYNFDATLANPLTLFMVWQGGMSFHGGFLGCTIAMILFARRYQVSLLSLWDVVAAGVPVGLGLVRVTNFINGELWGRVTDSPLGMVFPRGGDLPRHPSQLYEAALEGIVLFGVLFMLITGFKALSRPGFVSGVFVAGYGLCRIIVEFFREPDAHIGFLLGGWLTMGMLLSLPMVLAGAYLVARSRQAGQAA